MKHIDMGKTTKETRLQYCRLYNGEYNNPYENDLRTIWSLEKQWAEDADPQEYSYNLHYYKFYGFSDFRKNDGTPIELKALYWSVYAHWFGTEDKQGFKDWYIKVMNDIANR